MPTEIHTCMHTYIHTYIHSYLRVGYRQVHAYIHKLFLINRNWVRHPGCCCSDSMLWQLLSLGLDGFGDHFTIEAYQGSAGPQQSITSWWNSGGYRRPSVKVAIWKTFDLGLQLTSSLGAKAVIIYSPGRPGTLWQALRGSRIVHSLMVVGTSFPQR